jgi:glucokinase
VSSPDDEYPHEHAAAPAAGAPAAYVIALDVGGTGMKAALIDRGGTPLRQERRATPRADGPEAMLDAVLAFAGELRDLGVKELGGPPVAAGVAVPGILDEANGVVRYAANLGWRDVELRRLLSERLAGVPVALGHDVRTGGLAEGRLGAGAGTGRFFFVPLGTGIAGAIGIEGRIEPGAHSGAGEIGHIVVQRGGRRCGCGQHGCLETLASASAVGRAWAEASGDATATAADAARAVTAGDPAARRIWQEAVAALADGLVVATTLLDPEVVIIGGGLAEAGDTLFVPLRAAVTERITFQHHPTIIPAALGDAAGCLGAGLLAWDSLAAPSAHAPTPTPRRFHNP